MLCNICGLHIIVKFLKLETYDLFESTQFLRNRFIKTDLVPNISVCVPVYRIWILSFLKTKKLLFPS
jgi:hypothetical protein